MSIRTSRRTVFALLSLAGVLFAQPNAMAASFAHGNMSRFAVQAGQDARGRLPAPNVGAFASARRGETDGACDVGDNPMICENVAGTAHG